MMVNQQLVKGLPSLDPPDQVCQNYVVGKQQRISFSNSTSLRASTPLELIHGDLCGHVTRATWEGSSCFLLLDDFIRLMWVVVLNKSKAFRALMKFMALVKIKKKKIKSLRTNKGGELASSEFTFFCE